MERIIVKIKDMETKITYSIFSDMEKYCDDFTFYDEIDVLKQLKSAKIINDMRDIYFPDEAELIESIKNHETIIIDAVNLDRGEDTIVVEFKEEAEEWDETLTKLLDKERIRYNKASTGTIYVKFNEDQNIRISDHDPNVVNLRNDPNIQVDISKVNDYSEFVLNLSNAINTDDITHIVPYIDNKQQDNAIEDVLNKFSEVKYYTVLLDDYESTEIEYEGTDKNEAIDVFNSITHHSFDDPNSSQNSVVLNVYDVDNEKLESKYREALNDWDGDVSDALDQVEDEINDKDYRDEYFKEERNVELEQSRSFKRINEPTVNLRYEVEELLEKQGLIGRSAKYTTLNFGDKDVKLRIADHSWNPANNNRFGFYDYYLSVVIVNLNATFNRYKHNVRDGEEIYFDDSFTAEQIVKDINDKLDEIKGNIMETTNDPLVTKLKDMINLVLEDCDKYAYPHVCNMASDPRTKPELESMIIDMVKESGVSVGKSIDQIERAYNPNKIED